MPGKIRIGILLLVHVCAVAAQDPHSGGEAKFPSFKTQVLLETTSETSANVAFGDLNGDGNLDLILAKGRHWPLVNRVLIGDGKGGIANSYDLDTLADRTYTAALADLDKDGDLDVVVCNDRPDAKRVYYNDGGGRFTRGATYGTGDWPSRNATVADLNNDGFPDIVVANRGGRRASANYVCLNDGKGGFGDECVAISEYPATTIAAADFNGDGLVDLAVPHRNGGQSFVFIRTTPGGLGYRKIPFGPPAGAVRMSKVADFDNDGRLDLVTIDTRRGVIAYFQTEPDSFSSGLEIGGSEARPYALAVSDLDTDGAIDIIVGYVEAPSVVHFNHGSAGKFTSRPFGNGQGAAYGFDIGDFNNDGRPDIAAARSGAPNVVYLAGDAGPQR